MQDLLTNINSPLFTGIAPEERKALLDCISYRVVAVKKGDIISFEEEQIKQIGIVLSGSVDIVKEDIWGSKTLLLRIGKDEMFGETFACGDDNISVVTFFASENAKILFLPFYRVMHNCTMACVFHHRLIENMVAIMAKKNKDYMQKIEIISKRTIREKLLTYLSIQAQIQKSRYFELPLGRVELAEYLCVDRSALTRELSKMKLEGLIDYDKNCFRIL